MPSKIPTKSGYLSDTYAENAKSQVRYDVRCPSKRGILALERDSESSPASTANNKAYSTKYRNTDAGNTQISVPAVVLILEDFTICPKRRA